MTLYPGEAVVIFDPKKITSKTLAQAIIIKTPFGAEVLSVREILESKSPHAGERKNCLILGLFCG
ncbi:MAG: hypothetical protein O7G32_00245 [SAR324 cluster bacterium]|nr:hypothetical protein [SAR324 cluster bacterium]